MNAKGECSTCVNGALCVDPGTKVQTMAVKAGYYRFTSDSEQIYVCPTGDCKGGNQTGDGMCREGSHGPLCSLCIDDYFLREATNRCEPCEVVSGRGGVRHGQ